MSLCCQTKLGQLEKLFGGGTIEPDSHVWCELSPFG